MDRQWRRRREQEEGEKEVKMRRGHPRLLPGRGREEGWQVVEKESRGCKGYPEGANCSGVRLGCCQDTSCQHTPGARHTHTETHTHTLRPGPKCVNNPANFTPPQTTTIHPPTTPEDPIWNQSTATTPVPGSPCCRPRSCLFHRARDTRADLVLVTKTDRTSQC